MITFQNVTKHYDNGSVVVDGLSLVAPGGKITVFVGPSGCGKTTSLRMINRLVEPSSGRILLNGEATEQMDIVQLRRRIGYVIQNAGLFPHKNIIDNIATTAILNGAAKSKARARAGELLEVVGLDPQIAKRFPWQLSGGQQQRVGVARALAADPEFMLMDEPFSAVDPVVREQLQEEFLRIQKEVSKTIIMVTHDIDEAMKLGDLVAVLKPGGKLAQMASPGELLNTPQNAFVADFIGESNILNGTMVRDNVVKMYGKEFPCVDGGFAPNEPVDVVIRPEDIDIVPVEQGQLVGTVTNVTFKGMQYDIIVDFRGFKWLIQTTDHSPVGARIGVKIDPDGFHIMKKSEYSGQFGDYSSYSEEYEELADASLETDEEEIGDEE